MNGIQSITKAEYDAHPAVRSSDLKLMVSDHGPRAYYNQVTAKTTTSEDRPAHFVLGDLFHDHILYGQSNWFVWKDRRGTTAHARAVEKHPDLIDIKPGDEQVILGMADALCANPMARDMVNQSTHEQTIIWTDEATGIECKARLDMLLRSASIADLKTWDPRTSCNAEAFFYHSDSYNYKFSAAMYQMGLAQYVHGADKKPFYHIAVSKKPPHWCYVWPLSEFALEIGRRDVRRALDMLAECRQNEKHWVSGEKHKAWPDPIGESQMNGFTPSDFWLAKNEYGFQ